MLTPPRTTSGDTDVWLVLPRAHRVVLVVDVVESVRLMEQDEEDTITRWRAFVRSVERELLPQHGGRLVKSLGDGLMLEFERVLPAVQTAFAMQQLAQTMNQGRAAERCMFLRMGAHAADVVVDERDIYGAGVNLAARLATLAGPGEVVVSAAVRDGLVPGMDVELDDLGECYLKHVGGRRRAFRARAPGPHIRPALARERPLVPMIAVLPLVSTTDAAGDAAALAITDDLVMALSRCPYWQVMSRLSTMALAQRSLTPSQIGRLSSAEYVLSGAVRRAGPRLRLMLELSDVRSEAIVWNDVVETDEAAVLARDSALARLVVAAVLRALLQRELAIAHSAALPNLPGYALLLQSIARMHHLVRDDVLYAYQALHHLSDRHPRAPEVHAWLAMWHLVQVFQAWSEDPEAESSCVRSSLARAVDADPRHALTRALLGHACVGLDGDLASAEVHLRAALEANASEPLAWLFLSQVCAYSDRAAAARDAIERARMLAPLDPMAYLFENYAAAVYGAIGDCAQALACAERAVSLNAAHLPSLTQLIIAQMRAARPDEARLTARRYLALRPQASVQRFIDHHPARDQSIAQREAEALRGAGIPL